jgi:hypothetical protein
LQGEKAVRERLLEIPEHIEAERIVLRPYQAGDGAWFYAMSERNRVHLARYEAENVILSVKSEPEAETLVQELAAAWRARDCFFMGAFDRQTDAFVA